MKTIAVTGSKGKSTTVGIIAHILRYFDFNVMTVGTEGIIYNGIKIANDFVKPNDTTVDKWCTKLNCNPTFYIYEAISSTIETDNIIPDIAIFTNIEHNEHGEVFPNFEDYLNAKKLLFDRLPKTSLAIVNAVDSKCDHILSDCNALQESIYPIVKRLNTDNMIISICSELFYCNIIGIYNAYNIALATIACRELLHIKLSDEKLKDAIESFKGIPGRFELFNYNRNIIILDYAHSVNSLTNVLQLIKSIYFNYGIITVFGCGGKRDKTKRPLMGAIACQYSDMVYITHTDTRGEDANNILKDIQLGCMESAFKIIVEPDREKAINYAISKSVAFSNTTDNKYVILIAGKGNEETMDNGMIIPWSDREIIKKFINR